MKTPRGEGGGGVCSHARREGTRGTTPPRPLPLLCPCANTKFRLQQTQSPRGRPGGAAPFRRGGRSGGAALPPQTLPFPSLAASFPPLLPSLPLSAPRRRWLRGRGASGEHRCLPGPCPVTAAAPKATSPPSPPPGDPACSGPTWEAQVRGREGRVPVSEPPPSPSRAELGNLGKDILLRTLSRPP